MTDAARVFQQDVRDRKRTSYGARNRKCGSKSRVCSMPSDSLTRSQKNKLNGGVKVYQLKKPMTWEEFKAMPLDLQSQYIHFCQELGGRKKDICEMLGCGIAAFEGFMERNHRGEFVFKRGQNNAAEKWMDWVTTPDGGVEEVVFDKPEPPAKKPEKKHAVLAAGSFTFTGSPEEIFEAVRVFLDLKETYSITVSFSKTNV